MSDLQIQLEDVTDLKNTALVILRGSIDAKTVFTFQSKLNSVMERGYRRFIIDMELVKYVNSTGLGYLINLSDSIGSEAGEVALVRVQPKVKVVFDMLGLNEFFKVFRSREEAVKYLNGAEMAAPVPVPTERPADATPATAVAVAEPKPLAAESVPGTLPCLSCSVPLILKNPGAYKCPRCFAIFQYNGEGITQVVQKRRGMPIQMSISCGPESIEGLVGFVAAVARKVGFGEDECGRLQQAVRSCVEDVKKYAYNGQEEKMIHVLLVGGDARLELRLADAGQTVEIGRGSDGPFAEARAYMDVFNHTHHPRGGNVLTLVKRNA